MITWTIVFCFLGAVSLFAIPENRHDLVKKTTMAILLSCAFLVILFIATTRIGHDPVPLLDLPWIPELDIRLHLAVDGISLSLVALTSLASISGLLFAWNVEKRAREFFALYLALVGGVFGVFMSRDLFLLFVFYEIAIIPKYFLIAIWGTTRKDYAAMKLALYSFVGSAAVLLGIICMAALSAHNPFDMDYYFQGNLAAVHQVWIFPLVFFGFAVLAGLWPFHSWAPTGHVAAPTAASMLLAGVIMKLGAYGAFRVGMVMMPEGFIAWQGTIAWLALIGILYAGFVALVQNDFKFVIGYSSVSHMGFVMLGLAAGTAAGLEGAIFQMVSHGIIAGLLFAIVGRVVYERAHTRDLPSLEKLGLGATMPAAAACFLLAGMASMGMPGFSGFVAELLVLQGAWSLSPWAAFTAGLGIVMAAAFTLRAYITAFKQPTQTGYPATAPSPYDPLTTPEKIGLALLLASTLLLGIFPQTLLEWIRLGLQTQAIDTALEVWQ